MTKAQTIQIFLPDGSPSSIKEAEVTKRLLKAMLFPRNKLPEAAKREMIHYTGVYFLFGNVENSSKPLVYIGEAEDCLKRIQQHNRKKDFWTHCVIIATKDNEYTKTDGKYLEHYCLKRAKEIGRYQIENDAGSQKPSISESRENDLLDHYETATILLAALGYPLLEPLRKESSNQQLFYIKAKGLEASGELNDDGFLLIKGSELKLEPSKSCQEYLINIRKQLLTDQIIVEKEGKLVLTQDYIFNSPSTAAGVVLGQSANGWTSWKNKAGKTLDAVKRK